VTIASATAATTPSAIAAVKTARMVMSGGEARYDGAGDHERERHSRPSCVV
jgi:hypothetical protein